jgi:antitoxin component of MazEF toxin-antitoxin module
MVKTISNIGNSQGIIFDTALLELAHVKSGDKMNVTVHEGGAIVLTPVRSVISAAKAGSTAKRLIKKNSDLFRRLS